MIFSRAKSVLVFSLVGSMWHAKALPPQDFLLKRTPTSGEVFQYEMTSSIKGSGVSFTVTNLAFQKTKSVESNGDFTIESWFTRIQRIFNGKLQRFANTPTYTGRYSPEGELIDAGTSMTDTKRREANIMWIRFSTLPVRVGVKWGIEVTKRSLTAPVPFKANYEIKSEEVLGGSQAVKILGRSTELEGEKPMSATYTVWVEKRSGAMLRWEGSIQNAAVDNAPSPLSIQATIIRK